MNTTAMFHHHRFANGLTLIGETSPSARSVAVGFFVKTGSRDESPEVAGVSHFLEHMVFKGTPRRSALDVNRDFDRIGAQYNAYTSEENTVFYGAVLPEYLPDAVDILADILRPSLRQEDFDIEKNVIIEEIGMYDDQPMWCAYDQARKAFFADHPLGNTVLGSVESIKALTCEQMQNYFHHRYLASNITVSVAGKFDWDRVVELVGKQCEAWPTGSAPRGNLRPAVHRQGLRVVAKDKVVQEQVILLSPAPAANSPLRHAAETLSMIVGDDTGSRIYWDLIDPGLADSADMSFHDYEGTGAFFTMLTCEPENTASNLALMQEIFAQVQDAGVTKEELHTAKNKVLSRIVRGSERPMGRMQSLGMAWTYLGEYHTVDDELTAFEKVTVADIRQVLDAYPLRDMNVLALGPLASLETAELDR